MIFRRKTPLAQAAWSVLDCETSGLDAARDRLLSVAAVAVRDGRVALGRAYAAVLRQPAPSRPENIVVHGIGGEAQLAGREPREVLRELGAFVGDTVPVAFHAPFDRAVLERAGLKAARPWVDLAQILPALFPESRAKQLDDWLAACGIECPARHDALGDAFATALLLLVALEAARRQGVATVEGLRALERAGKWIR